MIINNLFFNKYKNNKNNKNKINYNKEKKTKFNKSINEMLIINLCTTLI